MRLTTLFPAVVIVVLRFEQCVLLFGLYTLTKSTLSLVQFTGIILILVGGGPNVELSLFTPGSVGTYNLFLLV